MAKTGRRKQREPFGRIRQLPSRRWQASYTGPDLALHKAASTFDTLMDARAWLTGERRRIDDGNWTAPAYRNRVQQAATFRAFVTAWLADRPLKPSTRELYTRQLDQKILPPLGDLLLKDITPLTIRQWYATLDPDLPTRRARAYSLLHTILGSAVTDDLIAANPAHVRGATSTKRVHQIKPATLPELEMIAANFHRGCSSWCSWRRGVRSASVN